MKTKEKMPLHRHKSTIVRGENSLHKSTVRKTMSQPMQRHRNTIVNDENAPHGSPVRKMRSNRQPGLRTPPRFINSNQNIQNQKLNEDFSFKSLRGNLVSFGKEQNDHFLRSASKNMTPLRNKSVRNDSRKAERIKEVSNISLISSEDISFGKLRKTVLFSEKESNQKNSDIKQKSNSVISISTVKPVHRRTMSLPLNTLQQIHGIDNIQDRHCEEKNEIVNSTSSFPISNQENLASSINQPSNIDVNRSVSANDRLNQRIQVQQNYCSSPCFKTVTDKNKKTLTEIKQNVIKTPAKEKLHIKNTSTTSKSFTPSRYCFKPKIKKEEVEATDDQNASVKKLSAWLSNDPFDNKKKVVIRKSAHIISKARAYENDLCDTVIKEKDQFRAGKVSEKKSWLRDAFNNEKEDNENELTFSVTKKKKIFENAFKNN